MAQRKPFRECWRALLPLSVLWCGCSGLGGGTKAEGPSSHPLRAWVTARWPFHARVTEAAATKPAPEETAKDSGEQTALARTSAEPAGIDNDRGLPPVVNTQADTGDEHLEAASAKAEKAEQPPRKSEAPTGLLPPPTPLPVAESDEEANTPPASGSERKGAKGNASLQPGAARGPQPPPGPGRPGPPPPLPDPHLRPVPTATGLLLNVPPGQSIAERALELGSRLAASEAERKALEAKVTQLTTALQAREQELQTTAKEVQETADEVVQARKQLQTWRQDLEETRTRIQKQKREEIEKLKSVISLVEKVIENSASPGFSDPGRPGEGERGRGGEGEKGRPGDKETSGQPGKDKHHEH